MAGPVHNLGGEQTVGCAVDKEQADAASLGSIIAHGVASLSSAVAGWPLGRLQVLIGAAGFNGLPVADIDLAGDGG